MVYAPESGSERTLQKIKKLIHLPKFVESILEAKRQGLTLRTNLIIGFPSETWWDVAQTLWFGLKMSAQGVDDVPLYIFSPYPGTEIFNDLCAENRVELNDAYFLNLTSLNGAYVTTDVISFNSNINARLLGLVRSVFILLNYAVGYALYPSRILRTIRTLLGAKNQSATVFEHRLQDLVQKKTTKRGTTDVDVAR